jgi:hypothetical protein
MGQPARPQRMVNEGPAESCIIAGKKLGWTNCTPAGTAMGLNKATLGRIDIDDCDIRRLTGDTSGGTTLSQMAPVCSKLGVSLEVHAGGNVCSPPYLARQLRAGRGADVQGNAGALLGTRFRSTAGWVNHNVYANEVRGGTLDNPAEVLVYDPAADGRKAGWGTASKGPQWWPWSLLLKFIASLIPASKTGGSKGSGALLGPGKVYCGIFPDTEPHVHSKFGGQRTNPFPDDVVGKSGTSDALRFIRSGPGLQYPHIGTLAVGAHFVGFQFVSTGPVGPAGDYYGDHDGTHWVLTDGVVGRGG